MAAERKALNPRDPRLLHIRVVEALTDAAGQDDLDGLPRDFANLIVWLQIASESTIAPDNGRISTARWIIAIASSRFSPRSTQV